MLSLKFRKREVLPLDAMYPSLLSNRPVTNVSSMSADMISTEGASLTSLSYECCDSERWRTSGEVAVRLRMNLGDPRRPDGGDSRAL